MKPWTRIIVLTLLPLSACSGEFDDTIVEVHKLDERNVGVEFDLDRRGSSLEFDLVDVAPDKSPMDVFRVLLHVAQALQGEDFEKVTLAYKGDHRFSLAGSDFRAMGAEFGTQNPIFTLRTFPEKLTLPSGESAFPTRKGGLLFLAQAQMQDFTAFNEQWFLNDLRDEYQAQGEHTPEVNYADDEAL